MAAGYHTIMIGGASFATVADGVSEDSCDGGPVLVEVPMFGASQPLRLDLGNTSISRRFTVTKQCATVKEAAQLAADAPATWNGIKDVLVTNAAAGTNHFYEAAQVVVTVLQRIGVAVILSLTVTGAASEEPAT